MPKVAGAHAESADKPDAVVSQSEPTSVALIPIRQLLKALPDHCLEHTANTDDLQQLWSNARWDGLAIGLSAQTQAAMGLALSRIPGTPDSQLTPPPSMTVAALVERCRYETGASMRSCCSALQRPTNWPTKPRWRLLAHVCQTPFYQRLPGGVAVGLCGVQGAARDSRANRAAVRRAITGRSADGPVAARSSNS